MASASIDWSHFSGKAVLPTTFRAFPSDLWKVKAGLRHMHQFSPKSSSMLMLDVESASDKPLNSSREMNYTLGGFYQTSVRNGRDSWTLGVIYSPMGWPSFPIPLVSYRWNPSERLHLSIGLPLSLSWQASAKLDVDISVSPSGADALATYKWPDRLQTYAGYRRASDQYFLSDRLRKRDAFFAIEQRLLVGLRQELWNGIELDVNAGYAFDRHYGEGENERDLHDRVDLKSSPFVGIKLNWDF